MRVNRHEADSGRAISVMDFEMRTFRAHFDAESHIRFDVPSMLNGISKGSRYRLIAAGRPWGRAPLKYPLPAISGCNGISKNIDIFGNINTLVPNNRPVLKLR